MLKNEVLPYRLKLLPTMHFVWVNLIDKIWYLFLNKSLVWLYREFPSGNLTNREKTKQICSDNKNEKDGEKKPNDSDMLDDALKQTASHSAQEMHIDGLSELSSSSKKVESEKWLWAMAATC